MRQARRRRGESSRPTGPDTGERRGGRGTARQASVAAAAPGPALGCVLQPPEGLRYSCAPGRLPHARSRPARRLRWRWRQASIPRGVRLESRRDLRQVQPADEGTCESLQSRGARRRRRQDASDPRQRVEGPAQAQATVDQWLGQVEKLKGDLKEIRDKAKSNDMQGVEAVVPKAQEHNSRSNQLATQLGLKVCNKD